MISLVPFCKLNLPAVILKLVTCFIAVKKSCSPAPGHIILVIAPGLRLILFPSIEYFPLKLLQLVFPDKRPSAPNFKNADDLMLLSVVTILPFKDCRVQDVPFIISLGGFVFFSGVQFKEQIKTKNMKNLEGFIL